MSTAQDAINKAHKQSRNGPKFGTGECLYRVRRAYGAPAIGDWDRDGAADAEDGWKATKRKHPTSNPNVIPAGVPIWWTGGRHDYGHVAISLGGGRCISTDIKRAGYFDVCRVDDIRTQWGLKLLGWSEDINGLTVYTPPPPPRTTAVDQQAAHNIETGKPITKVKRPRVAARMRQIVTRLRKGTEK